MNIKKRALAILTLSFFCFPALAQESGGDGQEKATEQEEKDPQDLRSWSLGIKGLFLYDVASTVYDEQFAEDPVGLSGENTNANFGLDISLEKQFTPFIGIRGTARLGGLSGANSIEYYENTFYEGRVAALLLWNNLDPRNKNSRFNIYTPIGGGVGYVDAQRYLISDDSETSANDQMYAMIFGGVGVQYEWKPSWRIDFEIDYNIVRADGFDGYNYSTAWDPYLSVGLGVTYTFGDEETPAMYATNYFENPYYDISAMEKRMEELEKDMGNLSEEQKEELEELRENIRKASEEDERQNEAIDDLKNNQQAGRGGSGSGGAMGAYQAVVYFEFDSDVLSREAQRTLVEKLADIDGPLTLVGYADTIGTQQYNKDLKMRRAESVKDFLVNQLGYAEGDISIETGEVDVRRQDNFLRRRVVIK